MQSAGQMVWGDAVDSESCLEVRVRSWKYFILQYLYFIYDTCYMFYLIYVIQLYIYIIYLYIYIYIFRYST